MTVTVLIIFLAVVALLTAIVLFLCLSPISVRIRYTEELAVYAGFSFLKFKIFPRENKNAQKAKKKEKKKTVKDQPVSDKDTVQQEKTKDIRQERKEPPEKKKNISDTLTLVFEIIKSVFDVMGKRAVIKIDMLGVVVSKPDAADTAVNFGLCGGIVSNILAFTSNFARAELNEDNIFVKPDFVAGKSSFCADITLSIRTGSLLMSIIKGYIRGISKK